jgi:hypothetical protein
MITTKAVIDAAVLALCRSGGVRFSEPGRFTLSVGRVHVGGARGGCPGKTPPLVRPGTTTGPHNRHRTLLDGQHDACRGGDDGQDQGGRIPLRMRRSQRRGTAWPSEKVSRRGGPYGAAVLNGTVEQMQRPAHRDSVQYIRPAAHEGRTLARKGRPGRHPGRFRPRRAGGCGPASRPGASCPSTPLTHRSMRAPPTAGSTNRPPPPGTPPKRSGCATPRPHRLGRYIHRGRLQVRRAR